MTKPFLRDPRTQQEYDSKGYVVIPFLDRVEVAELRAFYSSLQFTSAAKNLCSVIDERPAVARQMKQAFAAVAAEAIARTFQSCELLHGNFLVKQPGLASVTSPHQDWTIVDRTKESAGAVWMPLEDVDLHSGAMGAIPGSHRVFPDICCAPSKYGYRMLPYAGYAMDLFPYLDLRPLKAGEAIVFNSGVVHGSVSNRRPAPRVAATFSLAPIGTRFQLPYLLPNTNLSKFESFEFGPDLFVEYDNRRLTTMYEQGSRPAELKSLGVYDVQPTRISATEAIALLEGIGCRKLNDVAS